MAAFVWFDVCSIRTYIIILVCMVMVRAGSNTGMQECICWQASNLRPYTAYRYVYLLLHMGLTRGNDRAQVFQNGKY